VQHIIIKPDSARVDSNAVGVFCFSLNIKMSSWCCKEVHITANGSTEKNHLTCCTVDVTYFGSGLETANPLKQEGY